MAVDTPARIAIVGAGPCGLEAALYARFLGYETAIYERGRVAEHVRRDGHVRMLSPFGQLRSPLGLAALAAQDEGFLPPPDDARLTRAEFCRGYLEPLAATDLLSDSLHLGEEVVSIGRENFLRTDAADSETRGAFDLRLLIATADGGERIDTADVVIDAGGVRGQPNWVGCGGVPALGERGLRAQLETGLADILGEQRAHFAGRHTLVIGSGDSAATNVTALAELAHREPGTRITWITRRDAAVPCAVDGDDLQPAQRALREAANVLARGAMACLVHWPQTDIERLARPEPAGPFQVELSGPHEGVISCDRIIANVGYRPERSLHAELQLDLCPVTEGLRDGATIVLSEPNFYILGEKSFGRRSGYSCSAGLRQIVRLFQVIGDRQTLDLYAGTARLE